MISEAQGALGTSCADLLAPLADAIRAVLHKKGRCVAALDGMAAAGKTTAAAQLCRLFDGSCVHMDDFFLPAALRTPQRLAQPGGNVHYERFALQVAPFLSSGREFSYEVFDCSRMAINGTRTVRAAPLVLVEGAYSLHPFFSHGLYDVRSYYSVSPQLQRTRILARNGRAGFQRFASIWIPMENAYARAYHIQETCDVVLCARE